MKQNKRDVIYRQDVIDALWKALYEYEDKTEKQFQESDELDVGDWILHRIFVQNMSDIDRQTILDLPSAQRWVSCSERLPTEKGEYLVTYHPCYWDNVWDDIKVGIDSFRGKTAWAKKKYQRVIAWCELPEPYKESEL